MSFPNSESEENGAKNIRVTRGTQGRTLSSEDLGQQFAGKDKGLVCGIFVSFGKMRMCLKAKGHELSGTSLTATI